MEDKEVLEIFYDHVGKLDEQHICTIARRGDGRGHCIACDIRGWLDEFEDEVKYREEH